MKRFPVWLGPDVTSYAVLLSSMSWLTTWRKLLGWLVATRCLLVALAHPPDTSTLAKGDVGAFFTAYMGGIRAVHTASFAHTSHRHHPSALRGVLRVRPLQSISSCLMGTLVEPDAQWLHACDVLTS